MKLGTQALGAIMMALQKSILEQSDIVPVLLDMNFQVDPDDMSQSQLFVTNPPTFLVDNELAESLSLTESE
jgi:hypothetical protein|tara:strand:+ start:285 stop:497 length:213 start_codon:yes stop_codon:yes gene_type:complete